MKKVLVIGSTVVDVIINVDHLPRTQEDIHVRSQNMSLGGCAYNASDMIRHFQVPYILFSPVGTGAYGDFVRTQLKKRGISTPIPSPAQENGCCYCFVEENGERTFISYHGAEYRFYPEWFSLLDSEEIDSVYLCGLEIEESTGIHIIEYLESHPQFRIYFAPGPRINRIAPELLSRIFALHPVLHLNEEEALSFAAQAVKKPAAMPLTEATALLHQLTGNDVIVTLGAAGTCCQTTDTFDLIPGVPAKQINTIGAGDSHIGAFIACQKLGMTLRESLITANKVAAKVVETESALLPDEAFAQLF